MKKMNKFFVTLGISVLLVVVLFLITNAITKYTGFSVSPVEDKDDFRDCLEEEDIKLYINSRDSSKTLRGLEVVEYLESIDIVNCLRNNLLCVEEGVGEFPTWVINKNKINRDISVLELSEFSGCKFI